jgi:hypothetical protein
MSIEDIFVAIGFIVFCLAIIYYFGQCLSFNTSIIEGLENKPDEAAKPDGGISGIAGSAAASTDAIKAETVKIQDMLLTEKYKDDYVNKIIALDDYLDMVMLLTTLRIGKGADAEFMMSKLAPLKAGRDALNDVMKTLDKTPGSSSSATSSLGF